MKNFSPILLALLFFACESKNQNAESSSGKNQLENLEITIDTLKVDVGDELINASAFYGFGLSEDGQSAFFAEGQSVEVHEIDLAEMKWVQRIKFEKDGPNQAPGFINFFQVLPDGEFMLANYGIQAVYNSQAEKILDLKTTSEEYSGLDESVGSLYTFLHVSPDKKLAVSRPFEFGSEEIVLVEMDLENKSGKTLPLPNLEITKDFKVTFSQNGGATTMGDNVQIKPLRDRLVIYSGATADIYLYDWSTRELELVTFDHNLVPNQKSGEIPTEAGSQEELREIGSQIRSQVTFMGFVWDESRKQYFRFAAKQNGLNEEGEPKKADFFIFSYDENFQLLGEKRIDNLSNISGQIFAHEGKIYGYKPVDEDPGFVRMTLNY